MLPSFARQTVTRVRQPLVDDGHGNDIADPDLAHADRLPILRCSVQPGASSEVLVGRDATLVAWTVYAPPTVDVLSSDLVEFEGIAYSVDGEPLRWNPGTRADHTMILLKRWKG